MSVRYTATWYDVMQARQHHTHQSWCVVCVLLPALLSLPAPARDRALIVYRLLVRF